MDSVEPATGLADTNPGDDDFASVFAAAVRRRGLGLERLAARLEAEGAPVSVATLSYWQTGRSVPTRTRSQRTVEVMEQILDLAPGTLTERTSRFLRETGTRWQDQLPDRAARQILRELGYTRSSLGMRALFSHDVVRLGPEGQELSQTTSAVMKIDRGVAGWPIVFRATSDHDVLISVSDTRNCRLGQHVAVPDLGLFAGELLFHGALQRGDAVHTSYTVSWEGSDPRSGGHARGIVRGNAAATMEVHFDAAMVAREVRAAWRPRVDAADDEVVDLGVVPIHDGAACYTSDALKPGVLALSWRWE